MNLEEFGSPLVSFASSFSMARLAAKEALLVGTVEAGDKLLDTFGGLGNETLAPPLVLGFIL